MSSEIPSSNQLGSTLLKRLILLASWIFLSCLLFWFPLQSLLRIARANPDVSYVLVIPLISVLVIFLERRIIFRDLSFGWFSAGLIVLGVACIVFGVRVASSVLPPDIQLSIYILALCLNLVAGFVLFFGKLSARAAAFPLSFLVLMIPPPDFVFGRAIYSLQAGSAWITGLFFDLLGVPALRDGFIFRLPRVNIEIAKECSGIRSSMALLILGLLIAYFRLKSPWKRAVFVGAGLLMMIVKNGIRIATLTVLAQDVDPRFLTGPIHHQGGVVFFVISLLLLWPVLLLLERSSGEGESLGKQVSGASS